MLDFYTRILYLDALILTSKLKFYTVVVDYDNYSYVKIKHYPINLCYRYHYFKYYHYRDIIVTLLLS